MEYQYPIDTSWSTAEIIDVIGFFEKIEAAYEKGINQEEIIEAYRRFKVVVPSKAEEKKVCGEFEVLSGYSSYRTIKKAKESQPGDLIKM